MSDAPPPAIPIAYGVPLPPHKKFRWLLWLFVELGGLILLGALCAGGFGWFLLHGKAEIEPGIQSFQAHLDAAEFSKAFGEIGPEWKSIGDEIHFVQFERLVHDALGPMSSRSTNGLNFNQTNGVGNAVMTCAATFQKGAATVTYTLTNSSGSWKVVGHHVDSPLLTARMTCPKCGTVQTEFGSFCAKCGARMPY